MEQIKYREGFKYQLAEDYTIQTEVTGHKIYEEFIILTEDGLMTIISGYSWDGGSGAVDTKDSMRGTLVHDAFYQLMRLELIPISCREYADDLLRKICIEDGMPEFRAEYWHFGVKHFAESAAKPENKKKIIVAP